MAKTKSKVSKIQPQSREQGIVQSTSQSQQQVSQQVVPSEEKVVQRIERHYPSWPTSKPGPRSTSPLAGMRSVNPFRPEQMAEIGYNQEIGQPSVDSPQRSVPDASVHGHFDQPKNAQDTLGKRKHRL
jgi:hypothetical protein